MNEDILTYGVISMVMWIFVWYRAFRKSPIMWASPTCLFAMGLLLFYIIPSLYWQFRPWNYAVPSYFEGLSLVLKGTCLFGLPFFVGEVLTLGTRGDNRTKFCFRLGEFGKWMWMFIIPILIGIMWRINLVTLGWQSRLSRDQPVFLGSGALAVQLYNFTYYYAVCYFALVAFGGKNQRRVGILFWVMDGFFQVFLLHRYWICLFIVRSIIFAILLGVRVRFKHWIIIGMLGIVILSVVGKSHILTYDGVTDGRRYLTVSQVAGVLKKTSVKYVRGDYQGGAGSYETNPLLRGLDDAMYRLYQARSAAAVMMNVPDVIPYYYGKTFKHILFALVPRYFWAGKPDLIDIQSVTALVMPNDSGLNPAGTIAEFYMNYGFVAVLFGGLVAFLLCDWIGRILGHMDRINVAWMCIYPIWAEQFLISWGSFSRRACESFRNLMLLIMVALVLKWCKKLAKEKRC